MYLVRSSGNQISDKMNCVGCGRSVYLRLLSGTLKLPSASHINISFNSEVLNLRRSSNTSEVISAAFYSVFKFRLVETALSDFNYSVDSLELFSRQFCLDVLLLCPHLLVLNVSYCFSNVKSTVEFCAELSRACQHRINCGLSPINISMYGLTDILTASDNLTAVIRDLQQYVSQIQI